MVGPDRGLTWDVEAALRAINFFPKYLTLRDGQFAGQEFHLAPAQQFIVGSIYGWKSADGNRRFRKAYVEEGKGNGKSPMAAGLGILGLMADHERGAEVYAGAAKKEQALIIFKEAVDMVRRSPSLFKRIHMLGVNPVWQMNYTAGDAMFKPISKDAGKTGSGPRPHLALVDELHEHPDRGIVDMLAAGFKFRQNPLLFIITNSGSDRASICYEEHEFAVRVAAGSASMTPGEDPEFTYEVYQDDNFAELLQSYDETFSYVCALDEGDDPLSDESCWIKANPLYGVTIQERYLRGRVSQARSIPGKLNEILRLNFCVWTDSAIAWMSRPTLEAVLHDINPIAEHPQAEVHLGLDLSATRDMTALAGTIQTGWMEVEREQSDGSVVSARAPTFDCWVEGFTPVDTMDERAAIDKLPYRTWVDRGFLHGVPGKIINRAFVAARVAQISGDLRIAQLAYDSYAFKQFEEDCAELGLKIPFIRHPQGGTKRGTATDEEQEQAKKKGDAAPEGLWMPGSVADLELAIFEGRVRIKRNPVVTQAMMSVMIKSDPLGNKWFDKIKAKNRIDCAVALAMSFGAAVRAVRFPRKITRIAYKPGQLFLS